MRRSSCCWSGALPRSVLLGLSLLRLLFTASQARAEPAQPPRSLFQQSRVLVGGSITGHWSNDTSVYGAMTRWQVYGYPSASYFVRDQIGVGLTLGGGASHREVPLSSLMT